MTVEKVVVAACHCGCPPDLHIATIGCPCAPPGEWPCATWLDAATITPADAPLYDATADEHGDVLAVGRWAG